MKKYPIAIIGGGAAGVMAALRAVLNNDECILFTGTRKDKKRSREFWVSKVENMPGYEHYSKGIVDPNKETISWIQESVFKDNLTLMKGKGIKTISKNSDDLFELTDSDDETYLAEYVILCTGVMDIQPHIKDSIKPVLPYANKQTIDYCLRCDGHHIINQTCSIIGHGNGAGWVAIMLHERYKSKMNILLNGKTHEFSEEVLKLLKEYDVTIYDSAIEKIDGTPRDGKLNSFILEDGTTIDSAISFVSLGMLVYNELAVELKAEVDNRGFVITNEKGETNIDKLYIAGDLRAGIKKQIYTAWDSAVDSSDDINGRIRRNNRPRL